MQPNKTLEFKTKARAQMKKGIDLVVNSVKITLGPRGRNAAIQRQGLPPIITNDGVSIANAIKVKNQGVNMGVEMAKEVARRTDRVAGDGTTTTLILYGALIEEGLKRLEGSTNVMKLKEGMDWAKNYIIEQLKSRATPIKTEEDVEKVAYISVENKDLSKMIAKTLYTIGVDGNVMVEESEKPEINVEMRDGYLVDRGFASTYVINNPGKMQGQYKDVKVLVTDRKMMTSEKLVKLIEKMQDQGESNLLMIADDVDGELLVSAQMTHDKGLFNIIPVRFNCYGQDRLEMLKDVALACGTEVYGHGKVKDIDQLEVSDLGKVDQVLIKKDTTLLVGGAGNTEDHATALYQQLNDATDENVKTFLKYRLSNLLNRTAVIKVGALTEQERKYYKLKIDDAVNATRGAMEEGIVEGGGFSLAEIAGTANMDSPDKDVKAGMEVVLLACMYPFSTLIDNSGEKIEGELKRYNASTGKFVDNLIEEGVVDPVKVTINALTNAVSGASLFLTTEVCVSFEEEYVLE